jgi:hypothetical protein
MDQTQVVQTSENRFEKYARGFAVVVFGALAILKGFHAIACGWPTFSSVARFNAVVLLLLLVASPLIDIVNERLARAGKERRRFETSLFVYILATLAIMVFTKP